MYLPEELVEDILKKASAASLARSRCVSKRWKALVKDVRLEEKGSHATVIMLMGFRVYLASVNLHESYRNMVMVTDQFSLKDPLSKSSEEVDIRNVFHCDGLLLCSTKDNRLVVWNPCSRETRWIQPRSFVYRTSDYFALGKTSCNKYKILRMQQFQFGSLLYLLESEIYDFTSSTWRVVGETSDWFIQRWKGRVMSVNGNTYWLAFSYEDYVGFLQSFDFSTERFRRVSLPGDHYSYHIFSLSVTREEQQRLCLLTQDYMNVHEQLTQDYMNVHEQTKMAPYIDVWIATKIQSNGVASWIKFLSLTLANIPRPFIVCNAMNFLVDPLNKVLLCRGKNGASNTFLHVFGENKFIQVHHNAKSECSLLVNYVPKFGSSPRRFLKKR